MKLNIDCIRDVLLYIEENLKFNESIPISELYKNLSYTKEDLNYTCYQLRQGGFIKALITNYDNSGNIPSHILEMTLEGHNFLENIRKNDNWKKVKQIASSTGSFALSIISKIAEDLILRNL